ncbi:response regulator transcription factor [bacterium]|nr:response regulator transcription factor [bacterium]
MRPILTYIVDDELQAIEGLKNLLTSFFPEFEVIGSANTVLQAAKEINTLQPDLIFLDVEMGKETGFDLLEILENLKAKVVFLTAHEEYALRAIKISALDYILKPPALGEIKSLLEKYRNLTETSDQKNINNLLVNFLEKDKSEHKITLPVLEGYELKKVSDILYVRAEGSYSHFQFKNGEHLLVSKNLKYFNEILEEYGFYRIHHSTIINLNYINKIGKSAGGYVVMEDGSEFSISKSRKAEFLKEVNL